MFVMFVKLLFAGDISMTVGFVESRTVNVLVVVFELPAVSLTNAVIV